jgi:ATP-dependent Zn protease
MDINLKNVFFWAVMVVTALLIWSVVKSSNPQPILNLSSTDFARQIAQDNVREVTIAAPGKDGILSAHGVLKKGNTAFRTAAPVKDEDWLGALTEKNVRITFGSTEPTGWMAWLSNGLPMVLIVGFWIYIMSSRQKSAQQKLPSHPMSDAS